MQLEAADVWLGAGDAHDEAIARAQQGEFLGTGMRPGHVLARLPAGRLVELLCEHHPRWQDLRVRLLSAMARDQVRPTEADALQWATLDGCSLIQRDGLRAAVERKGNLTSVSLAFGCVLREQDEPLGFCTLAALLEFGEEAGSEFVVSLDEVWIAPGARGTGLSKALAIASAAVVRQFVHMIGAVFGEAIREGGLGADDVLRVQPVLEADIKSESGARFAALLERTLDEALPSAVPGLAIDGIQFRFAD